jgi:hypothetical protein
VDPLFVAFAALVAAGLAVSAGGWILFVRERRSHRVERPADALDPGSPGDAGARRVHDDGHHGVDPER